MDILGVYGLIHNLQRILQCLWGKQAVVPKAGKFFGWSFGMEIGVTQGYPFSPTIFNIVVDTVVRVVMLELFRPQEAHYGLVWAEGDHNIVFYLDDGRIAGHKPIWVQTTLTSVVRMFKRVGMQTNLGNTKSMAIYPGFHFGGNRGHQCTRGGKQGRGARSESIIKLG